MTTSQTISALIALNFVFQNTAWSQQEATAQTFSGRAITVTEEAATEEPSQPETTSTPPQPGNTALLGEYLKLMQAQAALMDEGTLKKEIEQTQRNINELRALQKLQEAQQLLLSITTEFPKSEAAAKALRMLDAAAPVGSQAIYPDDIGPGLNTVAEESPFRRSSISRTFLPQLKKTQRNSSKSTDAEIREFEHILDDIQK